MENSFRSSIIENDNNCFIKAMKDTFQLNRRSIISTSKSKENKQNDMFEKYKIKTLPRHSTLSLDKREYFIIVFQAIQIERLSEQIETQRTKIKSLQRKTMNSENYQIQIKQLTDQCNKLQTQISQYRQQLEKMNSICQKLYHQNTTYRQKYQQEQKKLRKKYQQEAEKNKNILRQLEQLKFQRRKNTIQNVEKQKLLEKQSQYEAERLKQKIQEIQKLQKQVNKLKQTNFQAEQQVRALKFRLQKAEQKLIVLDQHQLIIQTLNNQLKNARDQNQTLIKAIKQKQVQLSNAEKRKGCYKSTGSDSLNKKGYKVSFQSEIIQQSQKIDQLSQQICRLSSLLMLKNKKIQELYQQLQSMKRQQNQVELVSFQSIQENSEDKDLKNRSEKDLESAMKQIKSLKEEVDNCRKSLIQKEKLCNSLTQREENLAKQLKEIQHLRSTCQNQQEQILKMLKNLQIVQKSYKEISVLLNNEKKTNSETPLKIQQYRRNSTTLKSHVLIDSLYSNDWKHDPNQLQITMNLLSKISELQSTISELRQNYNSLFSRTGCSVTKNKQNTSV